MFDHIPVAVVLAILAALLTSIGIGVRMSGYKNKHLGLALIVFSSIGIVTIGIGWICYTWPLVGAIEWLLAAYFSALVLVVIGVLIWPRASRYFRGSSQHRERRRESQNPPVPLDVPLFEKNVLEIEKEIRSRPLFQQAESASNFVGLGVKWKGLVRQIETTKEGMSVWLAPTGVNSEKMLAEVPYRADLKHANRNDAFVVDGLISEVRLDPFLVVLSPATIETFKAANKPQSSTD